ncbi:MAG: hypothetical protein WBE37_10045 [Bryobacteraceae bacterium]
MSEAEFDADIGRKLREYGETKKQLKEITEYIRSVATGLSALGFGLSTLNSGELQDEAKPTKALAELPTELSLDFLRGLIEQCKQVRGRYLDLKSQLRPHGLDN